MSDPRFFHKEESFSAEELSKLAGAELVGDPNRVIVDVASLNDAGDSHVSFLDNRKYIEQFKVTKAGLCIVHPDLKDLAPVGVDLLISTSPYMAYALISSKFYPVRYPEPSISDQATVSESAIIGDGVIIEAGARISDNVKIGNGAWIKANAVIGESVEIGERTIISSNVTVSHCLIGNDVTIHPGTQIGQDGFGFASGPQGHKRIPQLGRVIIQDYVNIGANCTFDRGSGPDTVIGAGTQIDNLVQIGHNVQIGMGCVIVSQVGISGSTKLGNFVVCGGQAGIAGHLEIGDGVTMAAKSGVTKNIEAGQTIGGFPAVAQKIWLRQQAVINRLLKGKK